MGSGAPDFMDQRITVDALQLSLALGTVLFGGEERISLFQVELLWLAALVCPALTLVVVEVACTSMPPRGCF